MELTHVVFAVLFVVANAQHDTISGYTVTSDGPYATINLWWNEIPCSKPVSYQLTICKDSSKCIEKTTDVATYTLRNSFGNSDMPILFWSEYHVTVNATCDDKSVRLQEFYPNTGPGELLPLTGFTVTYPDNSIQVAFEEYNRTVQNASEKLELTICKVREDYCDPTSVLDLPAAPYRRPLETGVLFTASVRLIKTFNKRTYTSATVVMPFADHNNEIGEVNYTVSGDGPNAKVNLTWPEYKCPDGNLSSFDIAFCTMQSGCNHEPVENGTTYTLETGPEFPVVFWNIYEVYVAAICDGSSVAQRRINALTGGGDLLPLTDLTAIPDDDAVTLQFKRPDWRVQALAAEVEITVCDVKGLTCPETGNVPIEQESLRLTQLEQGILYNVSARVLFNSDNVTYTSSEITTFFKLGDSDDSKDIGFTLNGTGPYVDINLVWNPEQYPCENDTVTYKLTFCLKGFPCTGASTNNETTYTLTNSPALPVVYWNSYFVNIVGYCKEVPVNDQEVYVNTQAGELLPLKVFNAHGEDGAISATFTLPDSKTQNAADKIVLSACDFYGEDCINVDVPITETSYRFQNLDRAKQFKVLAQLSKQFGGETYLSNPLSTWVTTGNASVEEYPPVENVTVVISQSPTDNDAVDVTVKCSRATDLRGKTFDGIAITLFDIDNDKQLTHFTRKTEEVTFTKLAAHKRYWVSVRAMYDAKFILSEPRTVVFSTGAGDATKSGFEVEKDGPRAEITVWWEEYPCDSGTASYNVITCLGDSCIKSETENTTFVLKNGYAFPVINWNFYRIDIEAKCAGSSVIWKELVANTGPGELLPLQMLTVTPDDDSVTVSYVKPNKLSQNVADSVEIVFCDILEPLCLDAEITPINETSTKFDDLMIGVLYNVSVRLTKQSAGQKYISEALTTTFTIGHTSEKDYPPVENLTLTFDSKTQQGFVIPTFSCSKPTDVAGKVFKEIFVELVDNQAKTTKTFISTEPTILLPSLPLYQTYEIAAYAVYQEGNDAVRAVPRRMHFFTHAGDFTVPKPEIVKLVPVSGTSALLVWTHSSKTAIAFGFKIIQKQVSSNEVNVVESPRAGALLLTGLKPEEKYAINVKAYVPAETSFESSSDVQEVTLPSKDALLPTMDVKEIKDKSQLQVTWKAVIPTEIVTNCSFQVLACTFEAACDEQNIATDFWVATFDILPYTNYTLRVQTRCDLGNNINVLTDSDVYQYTTTEVLAPVQHLKQHPISPSEVTLRWDTAENDAYTEFYVQWTKTNGNGYWTDGRTDKPEIVLKPLDLASSYRVAVKGVRKFPKKTFYSEPTSTVLFTEFPAPDAPWPQVKQIEFTGTVKATWTSVQSPFAPVEYRVTRSCIDKEESWTNATEIEFKPSQALIDETECLVSVSSCVTTLRGPKNCSATNTVDTLFKTLPAPVNVTVSYSVDEIYDVSFKLPESHKELNDLTNLEYQITEQSGEYGPRINKDEATVITESRYNTEVRRKIRLCVNDLYGLEHEFNFTTHVGRPSAVTDLKVEVDVIKLKITWNPPEELNGPLDGYAGSILETDTGAREIMWNLTTTSVEWNMRKEYTSYQIEVSAYNIDTLDENRRKLGLPAVINAKTDGTQPPPPSNLEALFSNGYGRIRWEATPNEKFNATWFRVVSSSAQDSATIAFTQIPEFDFSALRPYTVYSFEVSSCLANNNATCGSPSTLETRTDVGYPTTPVVQLVYKDLSIITIRWAEPVDPAGPIDGYEYAFIKKSPGKTPSNWTSLHREDRSANLTGLASATQYEIHVRAFNLNSEQEALYSPVGVLTVSTNGEASSNAWVWLLAVVAVIAFIGIAYYGYTRYSQRPRETPLISVGPQTHPSPVMEEVDL